MIEYTCNYCGKAFLAYPSQIRHYCSRVCYMKWRSENLRGEFAPRWAGGNVTIACEVCGKEFEIKRCRLGEARFCSHKCEGEARRTQIEIVCEGCGVTFTGFLGRRFCSKSCSDQYLIGKHRYNWIGGPPEATCDWCGKAFRGWPSESQPRRFCSRDCAGKWSSKYLRGPKSGGWRGGQIELACEWCGKTFEVAPSRKHKARFCSVGCLGQWQSGNFKGANNPAWRGGTSFEPYSPEFNEEFKELIRDRDNRRCIVCGEPANIVHHVNYNKQDTRPGNCVVLCSSCHARSNHDRAAWEKRLTTPIQKQAEGI